VTSNDAPTIIVCAPDACISERSGKGLTVEGPGQLHPHAHDRDVSKTLDAFLAWLESRNADGATPMRLEIILLAVDRAVRAGENKRVIDEPTELPHIAGELRLPKRCLARA